jgi:hypothetical protein
MTTHHHFDRKGPQYPGLDHGHSEPKWEANLDDSDFLPALDKGPTKHLMERRKTSYPRRQTTTQPIGRRRDDWEEDTNPAWISIMYGWQTLPSSYPKYVLGSIIYRDQAFAPYMPVLKMTVVSASFINSASPCLLPFAVGQVQDAGLIFVANGVAHGGPLQESRIR